MVSVGCDLSREPVSFQGNFNHEATTIPITRRMSDSHSRLQAGDRQATYHDSKSDSEGNGGEIESLGAIGLFSHKTGENMMGEPICYCGHVQDEHSPKWKSCEVEECPCIQYEEDKGE